MKKSLLLVVLLAAAAAASATSSAQRSIVLDGDSSDFAEDEALFQLGEELAMDSRWGEFNDINQIKATWNADTLFIAVDGYSWDNNVMLFIDTMEGAGIPDQGEVTTGWNRKFLFFGRSPDLFVGTWDNNASPQLWRARLGSSTQANQMAPFNPENPDQPSDFHSVASFSQGQPDRSMELAVPWATLFYGEPLPPGAAIALVAVVTTGSDYLSGPDSAPNSTFQMPENSGDQAYIDNFLILRLDRDEDGIADLGVSPNAREGDAFGELPPMGFDIPLDEGFTPIRIMYHDARVSAFSPNGDGELDEAVIDIKTNRRSLLEGDIFDRQGRHIDQMEGTLTEEEDGILYRLYWNGENYQGELQPAGLYFARVYVVGLERLTIPVAVLR